MPGKVPWGRRRISLEAPRIILGHRSPAVTTIYAEEDKQKAIEATDCAAPQPQP